MYQKCLKGYAELGYQTLTDGAEAAPGMADTCLDGQDSFKRLLAMFDIDV